jgi:hypothetical protein
MTAGLILIVAVLAGGCSGPTKTDRDNRRVVDALLTSITMKNATWLEDAAALAEKRYEAGQLADWEHERLSAIVATARSGQWRAAERMGYEFRAERPFVRDGQ